MKAFGKFLILSLFITLPSLATAEEEAELAALAKKTQNPVSDLISLPLQNNLNFGFGPNNRLGYTLNIQPVIPVSSGKWNLINRTIFPVVYRPDITSTSGGTFGLGDTTHSVFFSPAKSGKFIWGLGPVFLFPTATDDVLGFDKWGIGPTGVALIMAGRWVAGILIFNVWSYAGNAARSSVNFMLIQYFINYNLTNGWYLVSAPILTVNWKAPSGQKAIIPFGAGVGKIFSIGSQRMNVSLQGYGNAWKPDIGPDWQLRIQIQFLFPKKG